jgi:septal ring factor EnvC (AmiA/AmiB activator)
MATTSSLERLEAKKRELEAKIANAKAKLSKKSRAEDTRRKILVGAAIIAANNTEDPRMPDALLASLLGEYITTARDRSFLGLPPQP